MHVNARLATVSAILLWLSATPSRAVAAAPVAGAAAVEATVMAKRSEWVGGTILTRTTLRIDRVMHGNVPAVIEVTELGGRVGDIAQFVPGPHATMPPGPRVALELVAVANRWQLAGVLERRAPTAEAPGGYVRTTNKDSTPPCEGDLKAVAWPIADVHYVLDDACSPDVDNAACEAAVRTSFQTWQDVACSYLKLSYDGRVVDAPLGYERNGSNVNVVKWIETDWMGPPQAQAITAVAIGCTSGRILDADILVNGVSSTFTTDSIPGEGRADVQNTLTHEVGHLVGFAHASDPESTMFFTATLDETLKRDLTADDAQGLCDVYPVGHEPGGDGCGCAAGGRVAASTAATGAAALLAAALLLATRLTRRRRPR